MSKAIDKFGRRRKWGNVKVRVLQGSQGPQGIGFKLSPDDQYDMQGKRLKNAGEPIDESDCVTQLYLNEQIKETKALVLKALQAAIHATMAKIVPEARQAFNVKIEEVTDDQDRKYSNLKSDVDIKVWDATATMTRKITELTSELDRKCNNLKKDWDINVLDARSAMMKKYDDLEKRLAELEKKHPDVWLTHRPRLWAPGSDPDPAV